MMLAMVLTCILVPGMLLAACSSRMFARWRVVRIVERLPEGRVRVRVDLVSPMGDVLREVTVTGSKGCWHAEDEWGVTSGRCPRGLAGRLDEEIQSDTKNGREEIRKGADPGEDA